MMLIGDAEICTAAKDGPPVLVLKPPRGGAELDRREVEELHDVCERFLAGELIPKSRR
jgi:hypothetical protein